MSAAPVSASQYMVGEEPRVLLMVTEGAAQFHVRLTMEEAIAASEALTAAAQKAALVTAQALIARGAEA